MLFLIHPIFETSNLPEVSVTLVSWREILVLAIETLRLLAEAPPESMCTSG